MTIQLTNEEKISVITQHIRNLEFNKYNLDVSLIEENAMAIPNQATLDSIDLQLSEYNAKIIALNAEIASLQS
jgi:hypothetical protein